MRLATVAVPTPIGLLQRLVALESGPAGERLLDVTSCGELYWEREGSGDPGAWAKAVFPPDLTSLLRGGRRGLELTRLALELARDSGPQEVGPAGRRLSYLEREVVRLPLLAPPLLRDFYAFEEHVAAGARRRDEPIPDPWYRRPVYYKGNPRTLLAPGAEVPWPAYTDALDYELEAACILGAGGRDLSVEQAEQAIAGYAVFCDFSARDIQADEMRVRLGPAKSKDFGSGLGPWLVTKDELGDVASLELSATLNREEVARGRVGSSRWTFAEMVSYASAAEPLEPGEVLASGTVGGGSGQERGRLLEPGDVIECELQGCGRLRHTIGARHQGGGELAPRAPRG